MNPAFHSIMRDQPAQAGKDIAQQASTSGLPRIASRPPFPVAGLRQTGASPHGADWPPKVAAGAVSLLSPRSLTPADSMNRAFHTLFRDPPDQVGKDIAQQVTSAAHEAAQTGEDTLAQSRQYVRGNPVPVMLGAFTLGLVLGSLLGHPEPAHR